MSCGSTLRKEPFFDSTSGKTPGFHFGVNGSRRGTRGLLVEVPVEVQLAENFGLGFRSGNIKDRSLESHKTAAPDLSIALRFYLSEAGRILFGTRSERQRRVCHRDTETQRHRDTETQRNCRTLRR